ncbi:MAG: SLC13 family permease [Pseudomonadota bacterium]
MTIIIVVFVVVYVGMIFGSLPGLKVDRSAIALIGAIALLATGVMTREQAGASINFSTIGLLFGLMIVSANFDLSGLYSALADRIGALTLGPRAFLAVVVGLAGVMSALLTNDVVAVALAPVLLGYCIDRKLNPVPFLLALACGTNVGSIATIIGSPQNMLIGEHFDLSFTAFMGYTAVPALVSMVIVWAVIDWQFKHDWDLPDHVKAKPLKHRHFRKGEAIKGTVITAIVVGLFIITDWPRDLIALAAGAILLANAHFASHKMLHRIDWQLLVLFIGLFVVNGALQLTGLPQAWITDMRSAGIDLTDPAIIFVVTAVLSDIVSNVPSIMLLLPFAEDASLGPVMAIASGLSSNLVVVGSLASIIVVDAAARRGMTISFRAFARTGVPITLATLLAGAGWLWFVSAVG